MFLLINKESVAGGLNSAKRITFWLTRERRGSRGRVASSWLREEGSVLNAGIPIRVQNRPRPRCTMLSPTCARVPTRTGTYIHLSASESAGRLVSVLMSKGAIAWPTTFGRVRDCRDAWGERWTIASDRSSLIHPKRSNQITRQSLHVEQLFPRGVLAIFCHTSDV